MVGRLARSRGKETLRGMLTKQQPGWPQKTIKDVQIIRKIELYWQTTSVSAWLKLWLRIDSVKMHIMASHILFWRGRYEEGKSRRVQFIVVQRGQFCNIMSMDCYPRWSISQNFPGNRAELYSEGYHMKCRLNEVTPSECRKPLKKELNSHFHISLYHAKSLVLSLQTNRLTDEQDLFWEVDLVMFLTSRLVRHNFCCMYDTVNPVIR